jgi:hypothetical protein
MTCSHFHGCLRRNAVTILQATQSRPYKPCTLDLLLPHQNTPLLQSLHSLFSLGLPSRVLANSTLFLTVLGQNDACKWRLFQVAFQESMSWYHSCLQDGCFLVEFYTCHPSDSHYNAVNQCFWLHYRTISKLQSPLSSTDTHLIHPSDSSDDYTTCHKLLPFQKWLNLTHQDMFIHGPFDFASVNDCKT